METVPEDVVAPGSHHHPGHASETHCTMTLLHFSVKHDLPQTENWSKLTGGNHVLHFKHCLHTKGVQNYVQQHLEFQINIARQKQTYIYIHKYYCRVMQTNCRQIPAPKIWNFEEFCRTFCQHCATVYLRQRRIMLDYMQWISMGAHLFVTEVHLQPIQTRARFKNQSTF